jgi:acyl-CoA thioesterase
MFEFDADRALELIGDGLWRGTIASRWNVGPIPNGGYVFAVALHGIARTLPDLDPLTATAHYLAPARHGEVEVHVEVVKKGRTLTTAMARMVQQGREHLRMLATFGTLADPTTGSVHVGSPPPVVPPADAPTPQRPDAAPEITNRFDIRFAPETMAWMRGEPSGTAEIRGRVRFSDGRPTDVESLGLFADAFPPPAFNVIGPRGWVPTLELTVHFRARPAPGWLSCAFRTRFLHGGLLEEDGELWDERGILVALSRQLAAAPP